MDGTTYLFTDNTFQRPISTQDPECQRWFNIGLVLIYAFNHEEAALCFEKCLERDPECGTAKANSRLTFSNGSLGPCLLLWYQLQQYQH
jgi:hypothetical protein